MLRIHKKKVRYNLKDNFIFDGRKLIEKGNFLGQKYPHSPLIFDEAGADLEGRKAMQSITQDVLDFYRECGQYNLFNILVLPEFFDLTKGLATGRSILLIDVDYNVGEDLIFERGFYKVYSGENKKLLYLKGKKELNYKAHYYNFRGRFYEFYPLDEKEYRRLKQEALSKRESRKRNKFQLQRDASWFILAHEGLECSKCSSSVKITQKELGIRMEGLTGIFVAQNTISDGLRHYVMEGET